MSARRLLATVAASFLLAAPALAAPNAELQNLKWFVVQGIGAGEGLAFYQDVVDQAMAEARLLLQGDQGPADAPCCVDVRRIAITEVALPTLQVVDSASDYNDMTNICNQQGGGSCAFLVDSLTYCGGFSPGSVGCADTPACAANLPNDNPVLTLVVTVDAFEAGVLAGTLAHERGHNACLQHVVAETCQLMRPSNGGGCLDAAECGRFRDAGNADGTACQCHTDALGAVADGATCTEVASGVCSGGVCGASGSDASIELLAAAGLENAVDAVPDDPLRVSGLTGGWTDLGAFAGATAVLGMEYAPNRGVSYGVTAADELITINPTTGARIAVIGTLPANGDFLDGLEAARYDSLAYDPGATASLADDLLYSVRNPESCDDTQFCDEQLVSIDPDTAATTLLGDLNVTFIEGVQGLAFDSVRDRLYASAAANAGIWEIDLDCPFEFCSVVDVAGQPRFKSALAYGAATDRLYLVGTQVGDVLYYDSFDAETFEHDEAIGIDGFTPGALAVPEAGALAAGVAAFAALSALRRRESPRRRDRAARRAC